MVLSVSVGWSGTLLTTCMPAAVSDDSLRAFSLGSTTTVRYGNDTTGTNAFFSIVYPNQHVSVVADEPLISQPNLYGNPTNGTFTFSREATDDTNSQVTVLYTLTGTATNGSVYVMATGTAIIPAQALSVSVPIYAVTNLLTGPAQTVIVTIAPSAQYVNTFPVTATMTILNTGPQEFYVSSVPYPSMYRGLSNDYLRR